jgi:hypothetical protein
MLVQLSGAGQKLVTAQVLAGILNVPVSWIYQRTMQGPSAIPYMKFGKYVRFDPEEVIRFFEERKSDNATCPSKRYSMGS